eukprot:gene7480-9191_t
MDFPNSPGGGLSLTNNTIVSYNNGSSSNNSNANNLTTNSNNSNNLINYNYTMSLLALNSSPSSTSTVGNNNNNNSNSIISNLTSNSNNTNNNSSNNNNGIPTNVPTNEDITITIFPIGIQVYGLPPFLMRKHTLFKRLFSHVAHRFNMDENELNFIYQEKIYPEQCPSDIGLCNGDIIVVRKVTPKTKVSIESKHTTLSNFVNNIGSLYGDPTFSDIVFKLSDNSLLHAHKNILTSRCPKFKGMFSGEMLESQLKEIEIKEYQPIVFQKMIEYIYTDNLNEENVDMILNLVIISDEYLLDSLKSLCESKLIAEINFQNVASFLNQSELYNCKHLKKASLDFILSNIKKLAGSRDFDKNLYTSPQLLLEIIKEMAPVFDKRRKDLQEI